MKKTVTILFTILSFQCVIAQKQLSTYQFILPSHTNDLNAVAFSMKYNLLASAGWDNSINFYNCDTTFGLVHTIPNAHRAPINKLIYNKQGNLLASASNDLVVNVYDSSFKKIKMFTASDGHASNINTLIFDNSGKVIFSGDDAGKIIIWNVETQKKLRVVQHEVGVNSIEMSNDPRVLFVAGQEPTIRIINIGTGKTQSSFVGHTDVVNIIKISPNQRYLLSGSNDKSARLWDIKTGKEFKKLPVDCWKVTAVAFSYDSKYCATGCNDGSIKIWEVETGNLIEEIAPQNFNIRDLIFLKKYSQIAIAPMLKNSSEFGVRIYQTGLIDPITASIENINAKKMLETKKNIVKSKSTITNKVDSVRIFRTPSHQPNNTIK